MVEFIYEKTFRDRGLGLLLTRWQEKYNHQRSLDYLARSEILK